MKLNLGSGFTKLDGFINVDYSPLCMPDVLLNLETPWPWEESSVDEALMDHVLEHLGETTAKYFHVVKELYRVCKPGAKVLIRVPHPRHDNFLHDCTHVRAVTPEGLAMFNRQRNLQDLADGGKESKLGLQIGVDFELVRVEYRLEPRWEVLTQSKTISDQEMMQVLRSQNNICYEIEIELKVLKETENGKLLASQRRAGD